MFKRLAAIPALLIATGMSCLAQPQEQSKPPVFSAETAGVVVVVIVTDKKGHHVPGLSASDFKLYEDNTPPKRSHRSRRPRRAPTGSRC